MNDDDPSADAGPTPDPVVDEAGPQAPMVVNPWLLIAGLVSAIVANAIMAVWFLSGVTDIPPIGNITSIVICGFAIWIVNRRRKGTLPWR